MTATKCRVCGAPRELSDRPLCSNCYNEQRTARRLAKRQNAPYSRHTDTQLSSKLTRTYARLGLVQGGVWKLVRS